MYIYNNNNNNNNNMNNNNMDARMQLDLEFNSDWRTVSGKEIREKFFIKYKDWGSKEDILNKKRALTTRKTSRMYRNKQIKEYNEEKDEIEKLSETKWKLIMEKYYLEKEVIWYQNYKF